ncbi:MAG: ABC transporter permease [Dehalococcoidaceae bacterium]|nr:ABC transporter permease [Dehalococcoidaceae bacterium]
MKFLNLTLRNFKETYRDPLALGFLIAFPLLFMLLFGAALGGNSNPSYAVGVIDEDGTQVSNQFITEVLSQIPLLDIGLFESEAQALDNLKQGNIRSALVIPSGFGDEVTKSWQRLDPDIILNITYDESDLTVSSQIISALNSAIRNYAQVQIPITINTSHINVEVDVSQIDFIAPGIIIFGLLIMVPTSARIMVRDKETGFMSRMLTTPTYPWEFISGYSASLLVIAIVQIVIFILLGVAFGMNIVGNIMLAFLIFLLTAVCSIGIGMVVASLSRSENQAEPLCWLIAMPLAVLSGVWFSREIMPDYIKVLGDLFPYAHAVSAARVVIIRGADFSAVSGSLLFLSCWAAGAFILGIALFRRRMRG